MSIKIKLDNEKIINVSKAYKELKEVSEGLDMSKITLILDFTDVSLKLSYGLLGAELNRLVREYKITHIHVINCPDIHEFAVRPTIKLLIERGVLTYDGI